LAIVNKQTVYWGADKSLARPGRESYSDQTFASHSKTTFRRLSVQPGLRGSNDLRVGRKMATFKLFFQSGRAKDLSASCIYVVHVLYMMYVLRKKGKNVPVSIVKAIREIKV